MKTEQQIQEQHERFQKRLKISEHAKWLIAKWLSRCAKEVVRIDPFRVADDIRQQKDYADNGDLYLERRGEVKHLTHDFTGPADWRYKNEYIVCDKEQFDRAFPKPSYYISLNLAETHIGVVRVVESREVWYFKKKFVQETQIWKDFYYCPMELVEWVVLADWEELVA